MSEKRILQRPTVWLPDRLYTPFLTGLIEGVSTYRNEKTDWVLESYPRPFLSDPPEHVVGCISWGDEGEGFRELAGKIPCVNMSNMVEHPTIRKVTADDDMLGGLAATHFAERFVRSFAFLGDMKNNVSISRYRGFSKGLRRILAGSEVVILDFESLSDIQGGRCREQLHHLLRELPHPCGIFCNDDWWAQILTSECRALNLSIPGDVSVLGVNNSIMVCEFSDTPVSSIEVPTRQIGYRAAQVLDQMIHGEKGLPMHIRIPVHTVVTRLSTDIRMVPEITVSKALSYMRSHFSDQITIEEVARSCGVSRRVLERKFKDTLECSPYQRLLELRIEEAKSLLRATNWSVAHIAEQCGFKESKYLSTHFRRYMGMRPLQWRKLQFLQSSS